MLHFPHARAANIKRVHRLVVLPDYQGIGIGTRLVCFVADLYREKGFRVRIVTSTPALKHSLPQRGWICTFNGRITQAHTGAKREFNATLSGSRTTQAFEYQPVIR